MNDIYLWFAIGVLAVLLWLSLIYICHARKYIKWLEDRAHTTAFELGYYQEMARHYKTEAADDART